MLLTVVLTYSICVFVCVYLCVCGAGGLNTAYDILFYLSVMFTMLTLLAVSNDPS